MQKIEALAVLLVLREQIVKIESWNESGIVFPDFISDIPFTKSKYLLKGKFADIGISFRSINPNLRDDGEDRISISFPGKVGKSIMHCFRAESFSYNGKEIDREFFHKLCGLAGIANGMIFWNFCKSKGAIMEYF